MSVSSETKVRIDGVDGRKSLELTRNGDELIVRRLSIGDRPIAPADLREALERLDPRLRPERARIREILVEFASRIAEPRTIPTREVDRAIAAIEELIP